VTGTPFLPGTEVLFMKEVLLGLVVPWVSMLPFVLVVIAAIEMFVDWLPSRLPVEPEEPPFMKIVVVPGRNGFATRITDPLFFQHGPVVDPTDFIGVTGLLDP
jgi:hypothetical protein